MNTYRNTLKLASPFLTLWLAVMACSVFRTTPVGDVTIETQSVDLGAAESARVHIQMAVGELKIEGGADQLMQATFRSNVAQWQPQVEYSINASLGELLVRHPDNINTPVGKEIIHEWTIQLNETTPIDLEINTGAGVSDLDLSALELTALQIETGAGVTNVDLSGSWDHDLVASITGGVGELHIKLPADMGVRVDMETALTSVTASGLNKDGSAYVNQAYGQAAHTLSLRLESGVGSVELLAP